MTEQAPDLLAAEPDIRAAEYVLGTLDADERAQAAASIDSDPAFAGRVKAWERRLGALHAMVDEVEPPPEIWQRIRFGVGAGGQREPLRLPDLPPPPPLPAPPPAPADPGEVIDLRLRLGRWRNAANGLAALAAVLALVVAAAALGVLPLTRPAPRPAEVARPAEPAKPPEPREAARFVAALQQGGASPGFLVTVNLDSRKLTVRRVSAPPEEAGKSYELWLMSDRLPAPSALGLIGPQDFTAGTALAGYDIDTISGATFAISLEPEGGSPTGAPSGPILFSGKLVEALPPP